MFPDVHDVGAHEIFLIEHHISLIKYQNLELLHIDEPLLAHIHHLPRGANQDVAVNRRAGRHTLHARTHQMSLRFDTEPNEVQEVVVLTRQLSGWTQNHRLRLQDADVKRLQHGDAEARSLARSILRLRLETFTSLTWLAKNSWQRVCLDDGGLHIAKEVDAFHDLLAHAEAFKIFLCQKHLCPGEFDFLVLDFNGGIVLAHKATITT
mmetsp:Transcript_61522/g.144068  ORF Transcript_61522/g.144068 Transcript_61522/m.144068 type:complete len:208 (+) Transcript_61522:769-1392(+)